MARILVANATSLESSWPAIRLEPWDCMLVQESRLPALSWLRTELRQRGWRYVPGTVGADGRDLVAIIIKTGAVSELLRSAVSGPVPRSGFREAARVSVCIASTGAPMAPKPLMTSLLRGYERRSSMLKPPV